MAEKIGADAVKNILETGRQELIRVNEGGAAMGQPMEPLPEPDYHEAVKASAALAQPQQDQEMSR